MDEELRIEVLKKLYSSILKWNNTIQRCQPTRYYGITSAYKIHMVEGGWISIDYYIHSPREQ